MTMHRPDIDTDFLVRRYGEGAHVRQIGAETGLTHEGVRRRLIAAGVQMRSRCAVARTAQLSQPEAQPMSQSNQHRAIDIDPEEIPSAEVIARAVVAAAKVTGEDPTNIPLTGLRPHFLVPAYAALRAFYPLYPGSRLGLRLGLTKNPLPYVASAQKAGWWKTEGIAAEAAAMSVLEGL